MADGTLKVGTITTSSGSGTITIGQSGETVTIPSGATVSGFPDNTPAFSAYSNDNQTISDSTWTKVELDTEEYDSNGTFATNKFTPAIAGNYYLYGRLNVDTAHNTAGASDIHIAFYKNGSIYTRQQQRWLGYPQRNVGVQISATLSLDDDDYVELYAYCDDGQNSPVIDGDTKQIWFTGYKIGA